jgi:hypothetical protein
MRSMGLRKALPDRKAISWPSSIRKRANRKQRIEMAGGRGRSDEDFHVTCHSQL